MTARDLYLDLARKLGIKEIDFSKAQLNPLIRAVAYSLNNNEGDNLLIFDEAGKFNPRKLLFLHELRDATKETTGIIIAGPKYFRTKIESWTEDQKEGIPEIYRRIQSWITIDQPSKEEMIAFCKGKGIKDSALLKAIVSESKNYGDLDNRITQARIFVLQEIQDQEVSKDAISKK